MDEVKGKVYPVHNNTFKFGTKGLESQSADMVTPADLENFAPTIDSYGDKDFQCDILHEKVDRLANRETNAVFEIDFCFERIVIGQEEVAGEADNESGCKRYIDIEIHIQHGIIYAV